MNAIMPHADAARPTSGATRALHIPGALCIIDAGREEEAYMTRQTTGIIALVLGILVLVWPSWTYLVLGVLLILIAVALLTGKMKSLF